MGFRESVTEMVVFQSLLGFPESAWLRYYLVWIRWFENYSGRRQVGQSLGLASALLQLQPAQQVCRAAEVQQLFCQGLQLCQLQRFDGGPGGGEKGPAAAFE